MSIGAIILLIVGFIFFIGGSVLTFMFWNYNKSADNAVVSNDKKTVTIPNEGVFQLEYSNNVKEGSTVKVKYYTKDDDKKAYVKPFGIDYKLTGIILMVLGILMIIGGFVWLFSSKKAKKVDDVKSKTSSTQSYSTLPQPQLQPQPQFQTMQYIPIQQPQPQPQQLYIVSP